MKIDLSGVDIFESDELELDKKITFIFGKNGTGKSTITEEFRKLDSDYEVSVFQGFNNIIDENHRLNAVVLGEENSTISRQIDEKNKEIEVKKEEINKLKETLSKPEEENVANFWTRRNDAQIAYQVAEKRLDDFYVQSASAIKNKKNPQVSVTSYNKRNFRDDLESASLLQEDEKKELLATIRSEAKKAPEIIFPEEDMEKLLDDINNVLRKTVTERVKVQRIENNPEKREFAKQGINLHKKGEICAFCGSKIKDGVFDELESYFSADEVKKFQTEIISQIEIIDSIIKNVSNIQVSTSDFYPTYVKEAEKIKGEIDGVKKSYLEFLNKLRSALDDKQKYLFEEREKIKEDVPENFVNIVAKYKALQKSNNENDIETKKKEAIIKMRRHYVKELMDDFDYASKKAKADILLAEKNQREKEYNDENNKIVGSHGLEKSIAFIRAEIIDLQNQTKNETLLAKI
jgi:hypothetical protein